MQKLILVTLITVFHLKLLKCQSIPSVPCPQIFSYIYDPQNGQIQGRITVLDTQPGRENVVYIRMSYPSYVRNNHPGTIYPTRNSRDIVRDVQQRRPVMYSVSFPTISPLPTVQEIMHNGRLICRNEYLQRGSSQIVLHFKLRIPNINPISYSGTSSNNIIQQQQQQQSQNVQPQQQQQQQISYRNGGQSNSISNSITCGTSVIPLRLIVGGVKMEPGTWPWLVAIFGKQPSNLFDYMCSGTLIAPHAILTAAHCVLLKSKVRRNEDIAVGLGLFDVYNWDEPNTHIARVSKIIIHNDYGHRKRFYDADVAIVILDKSYSYNYRIRPICMWSGPKDLNDIVNEPGHVAGWGVSKIGDNTDQLPSIIETEVVSTDRCRNSNTIIGDLISNRNFCAGYRNGQGPCKGDSGSGLMIERNGRWYIRGIVSGALGHVKRVCDLNEYVIYTDVAKFIRWIQAYVNL